MKKIFSNKKIRISIFSVLSFLIAVYPFMLYKPGVVNATSSISSLQQQYNDIQNLINQNQQKINTFNTESSNLQPQINAYQQLIFQKEVLVNNERAQVAALNSQINQLNIQIAQEQVKIDAIKVQIDSNARSGYEQTYIPPVTLFMGNSNITNAMVSVVYFKSTMTHENTLVQKLNVTVNALNKNKASVALKQQNAQSLLTQEVSTQNSLIADQNTLKNEQANLINQSNSIQSSNNSLYQQQQSILQKLSRLELSEGVPGTIPLNVPCQQGAYFSQECSQWGNYVLDSSGDTYASAGCSLIAIIMAENLIGNSNFTPLSQTALQYWSNGAQFYSLPGVQDVIWNPSISQIDAYASPSSPVVIGFYVPDNSFGTHFVTMTGAVGASGTMQDPWFGPNLTFGQNMGGGLSYSPQNIFFAAVF